MWSSGAIPWFEAQAAIVNPLPAGLAKPLSTVGTRVVVFGLKGAAHLNGTIPLVSRSISPQLGVQLDFAWPPARTMHPMGRTCR